MALEPSVEVDDALHELRLERPHATVIEEVDPARHWQAALAARRTAGEQVVVAEGRIAVDHAIMRAWEPPRAEHRPRNLVSRLVSRGLVLDQPASLAPGHRQQPLRR